MSEHAILSASGAERWMKCLPSARLERDFPETTSVYAEEGRQAHALAETLLTAYLADGKSDNVSADPKAQVVARAANREMLEAVQTYVDFCIEKINGARAQTPDAKVLLEQRLDYSDWVPGGFGTGDMVIISDGLLEIVDYKNGKGVPVSAVNNPQLKLYALGAYARYGSLYDFASIRMTIVQPRLDSVSSETLPVSELLEWGDAVRPLARQAFKGEGEFKPGDHCRFCRAKIHCRARAEENMKLVVYDFAQADKLQDQEIAEILAQAERLQAWAADLQKYALEQALGGKEWPGYKLVAGRSTRKYLDADKVAERLTSAGYPEAILYERSLLGITAMEKAIGKKKFGELLAELIALAPGRPALVPESDKRPPMDQQTRTRKEFEEDLKND